VAETPIEDLVLMGIIKTKKGFTAIVGTSQGFPSFVNVGDKFSDGYVLSINENQVVFRKTHERGIPLMRPRDIIKEISPEER
jgi:Tfp pilus assembly protein PilP